MPSAQRLVAASLTGAAVWGIVFGWLDDDLWTLGNWAVAVFSGVVFFAATFGMTRFQARRYRSR